jgi:hypothetical protein
LIDALSCKNLDQLGRLVQLALALGAGELIMTKVGIAGFAMALIAAVVLAACKPTNPNETNQPSNEPAATAPSNAPENTTPSNAADNSTPSNATASGGNQGEIQPGEIQPGSPKH